MSFAFASLYFFISMVVFAEEGIIAPKLVEEIKAAYPAALKEKRVSGQTKIEFLISEEGIVQSPKVVSSSGQKAMDESALEAVRKFRFEPAVQDGRKIAVNIDYTFFFEPPPIPKKTGSLKVRFIEKGTQNIPVGLIFFIGEQRYFTDEKGGVFLKTVNEGEWVIRVTDPLFEAFEKKERLTAGDALTLEFLVERKNFDPFETIVEAPKAPEVSRKVLRTKEIFSTAGTQGDPVKVIQSLPGVARAPFGSGQLSIRGSAPFESIFLLDDLEIPLLFHFGGIRTVFSGNIVDHIDFFAGGFNGKYGNAVGGVVSTFTRPPRANRYHLIADVNVFDAQFFVEGPVARKLSFYATARRSYIDLVLQSLFKKNPGFVFTVAPRYYDYQTALQWDLKPGDRREIQFYGSDDELKFLLDSPQGIDASLRGNFQFHTVFHRMATHWEKFFGDQWVSTSRLALGYESYVIETSTGPYLNVRSRTAELRQEFEKKFSENFTNTLGFTSLNNLYTVGAKVPPSTNNQGGVNTPFSFNNFREVNQDGGYHDGALFDMMDIKYNQFNFVPSLRLDVGNLGSPVVFDPRFNTKMSLSELDFLKGSAGLYHQRPTPQEGAKQVGNPDLESKYAIQYVAGYEREIPWSVIPLNLDFQLFYRDVHKQIVAVSGAKNYSNSGSGFSKGAELYLKYGQKESFNGWVSYTLSESRLRNNKDESEYPFSSDQTHNLTFIGNIPFGKKWVFGWRFRYTTGNPYTSVVDSAYNGDSDSYQPIRGSLYGMRFPAFEQLDVRLEKMFVFDSSLLSVYLEINNVYNKKNVENITYSYDYKANKFITGLPILPVFGVRGEF